MSWMMEEVSGTKILTSPPGSTTKQLSESGLPEGFKPQPVLSREGIKEGDVVLFPNFFGGLSIMEVRFTPKGPFIWGSSFAGQLHFDERRGWVCHGTVSINSVSVPSAG